MTRPKGAAAEPGNWAWVLMTLEQWRISRFWDQGLNKGVLPFD